MRQGIASVIIGLSLILASVSWGSFILSNTVLNRDASDRLAEDLLSNEQVRGVIADQIADSIEAQIPENIAVGRQELETAAELMMDDPRVQGVISQGIVDAHRNALDGVDTPVTLDGQILGSAGRDAAIALRPDFEQFLPPAPNLGAQIPSSWLSWLASFKAAVDRFTQITALISLTGIIFALILAKNRPAVLRRTAFWAFGASALWLLLSFVVPIVLAKIAPSSGAIVSAALGVVVGAMVRPAITLAAIGAALLVGSMLWPSVQVRQGAAKLDRASKGRSSQHAQHGPRSGAQNNPGNIGQPNPAHGAARVGYGAAGGVPPGPRPYRAQPLSPQPGYPNAPAPQAHQGHNQDHSRGPQPYPNQGWPPNQGPYSGQNPVAGPVTDQTQAFPPVHSNHRQRPTTVPSPPPTQAPPATHAPRHPAHPPHTPLADSKGSAWIEGVGFVDETSGSQTPPPTPGTRPRPEGH